MGEILLLCRPAPRSRIATSGDLEPPMSVPERALGRRAHRARFCNSKPWAS
jgi:hypothetical protein